MKKKTKKLKKDVFKQINNMKTNNPIENVIRKKQVIDDYYMKNANSIDTETLIDFYDYFNSDKEASYQFLFGLITTIIFSFIYDIISNNDTVNSFINSVKIEFNKFDKVSLKIMFLIILLLIILLIAFGLFYVITIYYKETIALSRTQNSYENHIINMYHKQTLNKIISSRQKVLENKAEYENREKLTLDHRIEVYTLERIE